MGMFDGLMEKMTGVLDDTKEAVKARDRQGYEYFVTGLASHGAPLGDALNNLGQLRWELVAVQDSPDFHEYGTREYIFKRPKLEVTDG